MSSYIRLRNYIAFLIAIAFALPLFSADKYWTGASGANASTAGNWCDDAGLTVVSTAAPANGDDIHLLSGSASMTWDLNIYVNSWEQDGYTGTVTFKTGKKNGNSSTINGYTEDNGETRILKVTGDIVFNSGKWGGTAQPSLSSGDTAWKNGQGVYRLIVEAGGNVTIGAGATVNFKGKGFSTRQGPGAITANNSGCATHGGCGSKFNTSNSNCYGDVREPITIGSSANRLGGGAVRIKCDGAFVLNGTIDVSGNDDAAYHMGAGGSIYITAASISGSGMMNANGGTGTATSHDEGGGGGRISVILTGNGSTFDGWSGTMKAKLGKKNGSSGSDEGSGGTIYMETPADGTGHGVLKIDTSTDGYYRSTGLALRTRLTDSTLGATRPSKIVFAKGAKASLEVTGDYFMPEIVQEEDASISVNGYFEMASGVVVHFNEMIDAPLSLAGGSSLVVGQDGSGTLDIGAGQVLYARGATSINGSVRILSGGTLSHLITSTKMDLTISGDLTVDSGGTITADALGTVTYGSKTDTGGCYGGRSRSSNASCYGSVRCPNDFGSTGKGQNGTSNGGGLIRITVNGDMTINGTISSNGGQVTHRPGSGGSIWLTGRTIAGAGTISADGGNQTKTSLDTAGGGGRIAVWLTGANADFSSFTGSIHAYGGKRTTNNAVKAAAGTVYLKKGNEAANEGTLYIVNSTKVAETTDFMNGGQYQNVNVPMTDMDVGAVEVDKSAVLIDNAELQVKRGWNTKSGSTLTCNAGGNLRVTGSDNAYFYGDNAFYSFFCDVPGKTLYFGTASGDLLSVKSGGSFSLTGEDGNRLSLRPATAGETWNIKIPVSELESFDVEQVLVEYSDASQGECITARNSAESTSGTCSNWEFMTVTAGEDNTWTGASNTQWNEPSNWSLARAPVATDRVIVPVVENYPALASDTELAGLDVASGASFSLSGNNLSVTGSFVVNGTLVVSGSERIDLSATNIILAADTYVPQRSVITIMGGENQTVSINNDLWRLNVEKSGGTVSWSGSTAVESVFSVNASAASAIEFASGAAISCDEFIANGDVGGVASLAFSGGSISVAKYARAKGVSVTGNNASGGVAVYVDSPFTDGGGNSNWLFGTGRFVWTGAADSVFSNDLNWAGGVAPGENDVAEISSAASITISTPVSVAGLILGGGESAVTFTARAALDVGDILYVGTNATLVLDAETTAGSVYVDDGGSITHTRGATAETYKINLTVDGDMTVAEKGKVTAYGKGYSSGNGPAAGANLNYAASHGGRGSHHQGTPPLCYGSYLYPVRYGSGGQSTTYGGGAIKLVVGGTLFAEGQINADGNGNGTGIYTSSGGSVWITCADLKGCGVITANGANGCDGSDRGYLGAGGRVAIYKTTAGDFSAWQGTTTTYGGYNVRNANFTGTPQASSGTVVWGLQGERPSVVIENKNYVSDTSFGTDLPVAASRGGDAANLVKDYDIVVKRGGKLNLVADATIWDLSLETANASVILNGHTLTIRSRTHKKRRGWKGTVTAGGGQIIWKPGGLAITVK